MKTNRFALITVTFLIGTVFGISIIGLLSFTASSTSPAPEPQPIIISSSQAHTYVTNYLAGRPYRVDTLKAIIIDIGQYTAMKNIESRNPNLAGFRIYFGKDNTVNFGIVVGMDSSGEDAALNYIYRTDSYRLGPCPPTCDANGPID